MCNLRYSGQRGRNNKLPPHTGPQLQFTGEINPSFNKTDIVGFNYIFPLPKYAPAHFQPGPVYFGGEASAIGKQPYNYQNPFPAMMTPGLVNWTFMHVGKGTQSAASYQIAQQAMYNLLAMRGINNASR